MDAVALSATLARPRHQLLLGGQRSGKSRRAEELAAAWLASPGRSACLVATALAGDDEMAARIDRHREDRARRVPGLRTVEAPRALGAEVARLSRADTMVLVDCLTLWLTNLLMPMEGAPVDAAGLEVACDELLAALASAPGPVVLVSNEIGLGLSPMTSEARRFVDELGRLHQRVAGRCASVTLMVAGLPLVVKATEEGA